jgi:DNA helicase TIP49 (TBP-interacting protein)
MEIYATITDYLSADFSIDSTMGDYSIDEMQERIRRNITKTFNKFTNDDIGDIVKITLSLDENNVLVIESTWTD